MKPPVPCPQCRQPTRLDTGNPWRPFCSERCKLLDLGEWFEESRAIPAEDQAPGLGDDADDSPGQDAIWSVPSPAGGGGTGRGKG